MNEQAQNKQQIEKEIDKANLEGQFLNKLNFINKTLLHIICKIILMSDNYDLHILHMFEES